MIYFSILCVLLAPLPGFAAAFPWDLPGPTNFAIAADNWSPAPTEAPQFRGSDLFRRQNGQESDNTCGYLSGLSESSITCFNTNEICATNTYLGVHGCCPPSSLDACTIPTTCIPASAMSTACTDAACSSNSAITKCTVDGLGECYKWLFVYPRTTMTQHGCDSSAFTSTAPRTFNAGSSTPTNTPGPKTVTVTAPPASSPTGLAAPSGSSKPSIGAIVGGTVGGCVFLSIIAFFVFLWYRRRKAQHDAIIQPPRQGSHRPSQSMTEYNPLGFQATHPENDYKMWQQVPQQQQQQQQLGGPGVPGPVHRASDAMPQYPGMNQYGIVEVDGLQRPVEAPAFIDGRN